MGKQERPANPSHDVSTWKQVVVGTDEFSAPRSRAGLWIALALVAAVAAVVVLLVVR
jgi:hypothetical protein